MCFRNFFAGDCDSRRGRSAREAARRSSASGDSAVIVSGKRITNVSRYGDKPEALVATSEDYGRTWSEMRPGNLPMTTSKPAAGTLSNGQRYLVCTTTADSGKRRSPLTIAVSRPDETLFSKVFVIRQAESPEEASSLGCKADRTSKPE